MTVRVNITPFRHNPRRGRALVNQAVRIDFSQFLRLAFSLTYPDEDLTQNWHLDAVAHALERVACGEIRRLIITLPPRHLKSFTASVAFPAWVIGNGPNKKIICASYSADLAGSQTQIFRRLVEHPRYKAVFPDMRLGGRRNTEIEQVTTQNGFRYATSVGGTLTGRGGDILIIDDPIKTDAVMSEAERRAVKDWFDGTVITRLNRQNEGAIILVMQRVHEDDLVGHVLAAGGEDWDILNIPARASEVTRYTTGFGSEDTHETRPGDVLCPELVSDTRLTELEQSLGRERFSAQYLQAPIPFDGNIIRRDWLARYETLPDRTDIHAIVQSWDTATATGQGNDYSVCTTWAVSPYGLFLTDVWRNKVDFPALLNKAKQLAAQHRTNVVLVEQAGSGHQLVQTLCGMLQPSVKGITPVSDKQARLTQCSHMFENGLVKLPKAAPWLELFERELLGFPSDRHDDQVDSVSQFLNFIARKWVGYFRFAADGRMMQIRRPSARSKLTCYGAHRPSEYPSSG